MISRITNPVGTKARAPSGLEQEPFGATRSVLAVSQDAASGQLLGETIRRQLNCRVLQASGIVEAQYLVAVEGNIRLLLADSLSSEHIALAHWFLTTQPAAAVLVAERSLWKLIGGPAKCEVVLLAKSYTPEELVSTVRAIVQRSNGTPAQFRRLKEAA